MEPQIRYAKTSDGVSIAYWTLGEGEALIQMSGSVSHIQLEWDIPEYRRWYERLAQKRMLIRYDQRGVGLSDRDMMNFSLDGWVADVQALADRLGLDRFALFGPLHAGAIAIGYAAQYSERVSHLILWCAHAKASQYAQLPPVQAVRSLINKDWVTLSEATAHRLLGWSEGEAARRWAAMFRESISPETYERLITAVNEFDVSALLSQVKSPTLVLHRRAFYGGVDAARSLAAGIPNARLVLLDGESGAPYLGDMEAVARAVDEFLGIGQEESSEPSSGAATQAGMTAILFADIVDSTALIERLGDAAFREKARDLDGALRTIIRDNAGTPIEGKLLGDGVLAVFTSARRAIEAALRCGEAGSHGGLPLHVGLHAGDVIREDDGNVYGGAVNIAARISGESAPGEVLVSGTVRDLARTSSGVTFEERGGRELKGVSEAVRVWAVRGRA